MTGRTDPELLRELESEPRWMYAWELGDGVTVPLLGPELQSVHQTRLELLAPEVARVLGEATEGGTVLDLACSEGWFAHRMLELGARRVVGIDIRAQNVRRAELVRDHLGVPPDAFEVHCLDVFDPRTASFESADVVLLLGIVYHVADPIGLLRIARRFTRRVCVIESQLTRQADPIEHGWGTAESRELAPASFALRLEHDQDANPIASFGGTVSMIPNLAALELSARAAGFQAVEVLAPQPHHNVQYRRGDRAIALAWPD
jgi:tRNA (mo5U34)-methyltransferase